MGPMIPPRKDRLDWDSHHMLMALITAQRSPDPNTQVGSILVDRKNRVIGSGYNGTPRGIRPELIDWSREADDPCDTKYPYVVHAEENAIKNTVGLVKDLEGATLYVTMFCCNECAKDVIQAGIKKVVYLENPYEGTCSNRAATKMFELAQVDVIQHTWDNPKVVSDLLDNLCLLVK